MRAHLYIAPVHGDFIPALPTNARSQGNTFRFDATSSGNVYGLTTCDLPSGLYQLGIDLGNGKIFVVPFAFG